MSKRSDLKLAARTAEYNLREARLIAVGAEDQATVTFDCMANRLREINDPLWLLCAARAAMQRALDRLEPLASQDEALLDARSFLRNWRK